MNYIPVPKGLLPRVHLNAYSDSGAAAKEAFHRQGKAFLRKVAMTLGLPPAEFRLTNNVAGIAVSGEVTLHTDDLYIQLHESCVGPGGVSVLYRDCKSREDYSGGRNRSVAMKDLMHEDHQQRFLSDLREIIQTERSRKARETAPA